MSTIQLAVFDIAGTTVKDKGDIGEAFRQAFRQSGLEIASGEINRVMGWRKKDAVRLLLEKFHPQTAGDEIIEKIHDAFLRNMIGFYERDTGLQPLPYAEQLFRQLRERGVKVALNTGFTRAITDTILRRLNWLEGKTVDMVISSDEVPYGRPQPDMIRAIMARLGVSGAGAVVKVGDTEVDVQEGRNAGCGLVVGITTGAYTRTQLEQYKPDHIIDRLEELQPLIA